MVTILTATTVSLIILGISSSQRYSGLWELGFAPSLLMTALHETHAILVYIGGGGKEFCLDDGPDDGNLNAE